MEILDCVDCTGHFVCTNSQCKTNAGTLSPTFASMTANAIGHEQAVYSLEHKAYRHRLEWFDY